jgi:hypothetical protein
LTSSSSSPLSTITADHIFVLQWGDYDHFIVALADDIWCITWMKMLPDTTFGIDHLAMLLPIVSACRERCHLLMSQCYWFCLAIFSMIQVKYPEWEFLRREAYEQHGRYLRMPII